MKIVITSGFYNPIHIGHIRYLKAAHRLGDKHIAIVNSDHQVKLKHSVPFMKYLERVEIVENLKCVDFVMMAIDDDGTVNQTIRQIKALFASETLYFAKGGDRTLGNIPEKDTCEELGIDMLFGIGGDKIQSSSELINQAKQTGTNRE